MDSKLIDKIKKLNELSKASKNSSEGERNNALEAMQKLLDQHNLSLAEIESGPDRDPFAAHSEVFTDIKLEKWNEAIIYGLCQIFDCLLLINQSRKLSKNNKLYTTQSPRLIGAADNIVTVRVMYDWIVKSIRAEARNYSENALLSAQTMPKTMAEAIRMMQENPSLLTNTDKNKRDAFRSFCLGAGVEIAKRGIATKARKDQLAAQAQMMQESAQSTGFEMPQVPGTALALIHNRMAENNQELAKQFLGEKPKVKKSRTVRIQENAFKSGERHGASVNLSKQISSTGKESTTKALPKHS